MTMNSITGIDADSDTAKRVLRHAADVQRRIRSGEFNAFAFDGQMQAFIARVAFSEVERDAYMALAHSHLTTIVQQSREDEWMPGRGAFQAHPRGRSRAQRDSKAARIRELDDGTRTPKEISDIVGCGTEYVRTARQRSAGKSEYDLKYQARKAAEANAEVAP
jgi:hypothetical protein